MAKKSGPAARLRPSAPDNPLKARDAYDAWNAAFLTRFYTARAAAIMASGDDVRIRLYERWLDKQRG